MMKTNKRTFLLLHLPDDILLLLLSFLYTYDCLKLDNSITCHANNVRFHWKTLLDRHLGPNYLPTYSLSHHLPPPSPSIEGKEKIYCMTLLPNDCLATANGDEIRIWQLTSGECLKTLLTKEVTDSLIDLKYAEDCEMILGITNVGSSLQCWHLKDESCHFHFPFPNQSIPEIMTVLRRNKKNLRRGRGDGDAERIEREGCWGESVELAVAGVNLITHVWNVFILSLKKLPSPYSSVASLSSSLCSPTIEILGIIPSDVRIVSLLHLVNNHLAFNTIDSLIEVWDISSITGPASTTSTISSSSYLTPSCLHVFEVYRDRLLHPPILELPDGRLVGAGNTQVGLFQLKTAAPSPPPPPPQPPANAGATSALPGNEFYDLCGEYSVFPYFIQSIEMISSKRIAIMVEDVDRLSYGIQILNVMTFEVERQTRMKSKAENPFSIPLLSWGEGKGIITHEGKKVCVWLPS